MFNEIRSSSCSLATGLFSQSVIAKDAPSFTFAEAFYTQSDFDSDFDTSGFVSKVHMNLVNTFL